MRPFPVLATVLLVGVCQPTLAADPGEAWFTETGSAVPPDGVQWLPPESLCPVLKDKLPETVQTLDSKSFVALDLKSLPAYAGKRCKGKYGQLPFLVRAVSTAGEGHLDAGLLHGQLWLRYAGAGGEDPFEKTPVVLWLYSAPSQVHITASLVL